MDASHLSGKDAAPGKVMGSLPWGCAECQDVWGPALLPTPSQPPAQGHAKVSVFALAEGVELGGWSLAQDELMKNDDSRSLYLKKTPNKTSVTWWECTFCSRDPWVSVHHRCASQLAGWEGGVPLAFANRRGHGGHFLALQRPHYSPIGNPDRTLASRRDRQSQHPGLPASDWHQGGWWTAMPTVISGT